MFLDEQLLTIARSTNVESEQEIHESIKKMIQTCMRSIGNIHKEESRQNTNALRSTFRKTEMIWTNVAYIMQQEGIGFINPEGFRSFVKNRDELKAMLD